jgi:uncharacterized protein with PIN domain/sulfur carrier protein ThiS
MAVAIRFYEELNDFLPREQRRQAVEVPWSEPRSVKDLIESLGVPHTEVDLILVNGEPTGFRHLVRDGDRVAVYPVFESLDIRAVSKLERAPLRHIHFIADVHLGKLVRRLRLLGFDCLYDPQLDDEQLAEISARENRVLLTRDRDLLKRSIVLHGIYLRSDQPAEQVREVVRRLDLQEAIRPFSRCLTCNGRFRAVSKEEVRDRIPPLTYTHIDTFYECRNCGKIYWQGAHWERLQRILRQVTDSA